MGKRTPLYATHVALGGKMVDFAGWDMPIHYGSQIDEHHQVRQAAGMFDVSHMCVVDVEGARARDFLRYLVANDVARAGAPGKAIYSCMLNEKGGVIDDLIIYHMRDDWFRMVVNAGTRDKDLAWMRQQAPSFSVDVNERDDLGVVAVQGPEARDKAHTALGAEAADVAKGLKRFAAAVAGDYFIGRTGYTGEDGYEIVLPAEQVENLWQALHDAGVGACGLGARDTLRLEAGMNLYGQDMDEQTTPLESGLAWTVAWEPEDRDFIGRQALQAQREAGVPHRLVGLVLEDRGVLRPHQKVFVDGGEGEVTSGSFSPTLGRAIALARIPNGEADAVEVEVRGKRMAARVVKPPFVRDGQSCVEPVEA